jgi:hypothetical protein
LPQIHVDDEVYAAMEAEAIGFETPNDVLRRKFLGNGAGHTSSPRRSASSGSGRSAGGGLTELIASGLIAPGDELSHVRVRSGQRLSGVVEEDGCIKTKLGRYASPSPALGGLTGTAINGWANWIHVPSGKTLDQLRKELGND